MEREDNLIYSKRFPRIGPNTQKAELDEYGDVPLVKPRESLEAIFKRITENGAYIIDPNKAAARQRFVDLAIELSLDYAIDMDIKDYTYYTSVSMYLDCASCTGDLKCMFAELIHMSDHISSFISETKPCDFIIVLDYYTHVHYLAERRLDF